MKKTNVTMKTLLETVKKLETEAYKDYVPGYGKGKGASAKNWSMTPDELANDYEDSEKTSPERPSVKAAAKASDEEEYIQSLMKVAEEMAGIYFDDSDATRTTTYNNMNMDDTIEDESYSTTEFVERAADALAGSIKTNIKAYASLSPQAMEKAVKKELMDVLRDMDNTDLFDRS